MKILVSWSGELSHAVAVHLREWLPVVLPFARPWVSSEDIPKGSRWIEQLAAELNATPCGIICVTPGNIQEPWLNFEAGALSKAVERVQVHPFLIGVSPGDLTGPLSQFQATTFSRDDVRRLLRTINDAARDAAVTSETLDRNLNICWTDLERRLTPLVDQAGRTQETSNAASGQEPSGDALTEEEITALRTLIPAKGERVFPQQLADALSIHPERAKHIMEKLEAAGLLHASHNYVHGTSWLLSREGRAELVRRNLL